MTPEQLIKLTILTRNADYNNLVLEKDLSIKDIEEMFEALRHDDNYGVIEEIREGVVETNILPSYSPYERHYESNSVALQTTTGQWVGWTYWHGGGKHSEPSAIPWMEYAYFLDCVEEEKMVVVRTFLKQSEG